MIHSENVSDVYAKRNVPLWLISAFKAGFINSAGLLVTGKFVSHVTGFGTQVGIAVGHKDYFFGAELFIIPISFIMGGVITSYFLDRNYKIGETPPYWKVQSLITLLLLVIISLGEMGMVKTEFKFDKDFKYDYVEFAIIGMLCLICGLKNSLVTWSTFGKVRVTHLTGLSTDIGLNLIRTFSKKQPSPRLTEERRVNILRMLTFAFFSTGALISALIYPNLGFKTFFIPLTISVGMSIISIIDCKIRMKKNLLLLNDSFILQSEK